MIPSRVLIALLVAGTTLAACGGGDDAATGAGGVVPSIAAQAGDRLPDVEIAALDGTTTISLADVAGPAVVNLWATWCAPCRREIPDFEAVHQARGGEVRFIGVNIGEDAADARAFLDEVGATYDQYLDSEGYVVTELGAATMPVTLVLGADGTISTEHLGPMSQDDLDAAIDEAIDG